jgi:hypothetical protein
VRSGSVCLANQSLRYLAADCRSQQGKPAYWLPNRGFPESFIFMDPITIAMLVREGLKILKVGKETFYPNKTIKEAESLLRKEMEGNVQSLQAQVQAHRQVMDKLIDQVKADKEMIEKHNEVLIHLSEAAEQAAQDLGRLRVMAYCAIGVAGLSLLGGALLGILK